MSAAESRVSSARNDPLKKAVGAAKKPDLKSSFASILSVASIANGNDNVLLFLLYVHRVLTKTRRILFKL